MSPRLPPELERTIFEMVAWQWRGSIPPLLRVARRVKHWLEPILYETILVTEDQDSVADVIYWHSTHEIKSLIAQRDPASFSALVHNVFLSPTISEDERNHICESFPNLSNLYTTLKAALNAPLPRLLKLYAPPHVLSFDQSTLSTRFPSLTHLYLFSRSIPLYVWAVGPLKNVTWSALGQLPRLSHLLLTSSPGTPALDSILESCPSLILLLILRPTYTLYPSHWHPPPTPTSTHDVRLVVVPINTRYHGVTHWQHDAFAVPQWRESLWKKGERLAEARRNGTVDAEHYELPEEPTSRVDAFPLPSPQQN
ncbi:hypothetical protein MIND_00576600 [Mycena indigotica]|uniref:Uncharacterized protein n=1 Tax=Mycena indigotica TaxID=2126181 RepID=A0A8H6SRP0_9AGAR|nr:uncharacterized protein MIND_00576600 [Mycena indigotica]KAF7303476.1 hypothetical protein MIND_00576600 [Mycena indigotica]